MDAPDTTTNPDSDPDRATVELTLPSDPKYLALVRVVVGAAAAATPSLTESRIADAKLVVTELFANAMEANWRAAGLERPPGGSVSVEPCVAPVHLVCRADALGVTLTVSDRGPGLDATDDVHPPVRDPSRLDHERGLGIPLIQYLADEVDYDSDENGTRATVTLRDRRSST